MTHAPASGSQRSRREAVTGAGLPPALGPYSQAVRAGDVLYVSGQAAIGDVPGQPVGPTFAEQARQAFANLEKILHAGGSRLDLVVNVTVMLADTSAFAELNEVYAEVFPTDPPARMTMQIGLAPGFLISVACVALVE